MKMNEMNEWVLIKTQKGQKSANQSIGLAYIYISLFLLIKLNIIFKTYEHH